MPDTTYLLCGFARGLDWRPISFKQRLQTTRVCLLCGVVPQSIALLPCTHFLCESCLDSCANGADRHACPLDKTSFDAESDVSWITFPQKHMEKLLVGCWNAKYGCDFTGPAAELLEHFERQCSFHAIKCSRCPDAVLRKDLPRHFEAGCNGVASLPQTVAGHVSATNLSAATMDGARRRDTATDCSCHDMLTSIQDRVNDLAEALDKLGYKRLLDETADVNPSISRGIPGLEAKASVNESTPLSGTPSLGALVSALNEMKIVVTDGFRKMERRVGSENLAGASSSSKQQPRSQMAAVANRPARNAAPPIPRPLEMPGCSGGYCDVATSETAEELFVFSVQYKPWLTAEKGQGLKIAWHPIFIGSESTGVCIRCVVQRNASFIAVYAMCTMPARWKLPVVRPLRAEDLSSPNLREWIVEKAKEPSRDYLPVGAYAPDLRLRCMLEASSLAPKTIVEGEIQVDFLVKLERRFPATGN